MIVGLFQVQNHYQKKKKKKTIRKRLSNNFYTHYLSTIITVTIKQAKERDFWVKIQNQAFFSYLLPEKYNSLFL